MYLYEAIWISLSHFWKEPYIKEYILYDSIYIKYNNTVMGIHDDKNQNNNYLWV